MSSVTATRTPEVIIEDIRMSLFCPASCNTLSDAVMFLPCTHRVSKAGLGLLFPTSKSKSSTCVICKKPYTHFVEDPFVGKLTDKFLELFAAFEKHKEKTSLLDLKEGKEPTNSEETLLSPPPPLFPTSKTSTPSSANSSFSSVSSSLSSSSSSTTRSTTPTIPEQEFPFPGQAGIFSLTESLINIRVFTALSTEQTIQQVQVKYKNLMIREVVCFLKNPTPPQVTEYFKTLFKISIGQLIDSKNPSKQTLSFKLKEPKAISQFIILLETTEHILPEGEYESLKSDSTKILENGNNNTLEEDYEIFAFDE